MRKHGRMCYAMFIMIVPLSVAYAEVTYTDLPQSQGWEAPVAGKRFALSQDQTLAIQTTPDFEREGINPLFVFSDGSVSPLKFFKSRRKGWYYRVDFCNELQSLKRVPNGHKKWRLTLTLTSLVLECNGETLLNFNFAEDGRGDMCEQTWTNKQISSIMFSRLKHFVIRAEESICVVERTKIKKGEKLGFGCPRGLTNYGNSEGTCVVADQFNFTRKPPLCKYASRTWTSWSHSGSEGIKMAKSCPQGFYVLDMVWLYRSGHGVIDLALKCHDPDRRSSQFVDFVGHERLIEDGLADRKRPDSSDIWGWFPSFTTLLDLDGSEASNYVNKPDTEWFDDELSAGAKCSGKGGIDSFLGHSQSCCGLVNTSFRCTDSVSWYKTGTNINGKQNKKIQCPAGQAFVGAEVVYGETTEFNKIFNNNHPGITDVRFQCEESKYPPVAACVGLPSGWKSVITSASFPVEIGKVIQVSCSRGYINMGDIEVTCVRKDQFSYTEEPFCKDGCYTSYEMNVGLFPDSQKLAQSEFRSFESCQEWCDDTPLCKGVAVSPWNWARESRECFLVGTMHITARSGWTASSLSDCDQGRGLHKTTAITKQA
ncbi:uncharacterized protein LOC134815967 [Bolinopsis microptera]|uniref:uncharacterized protein LOC134815967 n=1 Tax=Bolinopsis microptera TaxID=2820187 RepID=UPI00307A346D